MTDDNPVPGGAFCVEHHSGLPGAHGCELPPIASTATSDGEDARPAQARDTQQRETDQRRLLHMDHSQGGDR
jgi:hypothetical protein